MKKMLLVLLCLFLAGCATFSDIRNINRENLNKLSLGMTKQEALKIMGTETKQACPPAPLALISLGMSATQCQNISSPYRTEILQGKDKALEVLYYYTDIKKEDNAITDDELTPLVFDNGKLIGWGWTFLQDNAQKYEIRIR